MNLALGLGIGARSGAASLYAPGADPAVILYYDALAAAQITESGGAVSQMLSLGQWARPVVQSTALAQPLLTDGAVAFDGFTDFLDGRQTPTATLVSAYELPDAQGGDEGKGFTNTGLARAADGTWWVGNDGRNLPGATNTASLVHLSADFSTKLDEIDIEALVPATGSIQGVVVDPLDGSLWYASPQEQKVYHITTAGVLIAADTLDMGFQVNGLAIDPVRRRLWVHEYEGTSVREVDMATKAVLRTMEPFHAQGDHLWFEATQNRLWQTCDDAKVRVWDVNETLGAAPAFVAVYDVPDADEIEGVVVAGSKMFLCNDAYFHGGSPALNRILEYDVTHVHQGSVLTDEALIFGVFDRPAIQGTTTALLAFGNPIAEPGVGLYFPEDTTDLRLILNSATGSGARDILDWTSVDTTSEHVFALALDYGAAAATLFVDGAQVGAPQALPNLSARPPLHNLVLGAAAESSIARFSNAQVKAVGAAHALADRQKIEGALAWRHGLEVQLDAGHPYKSAPP